MIGLVYLFSIKTLQYILAATYKDFPNIEKIQAFSNENIHMPVFE